MTSPAKQGNCAFLKVYLTTGGLALVVFQHSALFVFTGDKHSHFLAGCTDINLPAGLQLNLTGYFNNNKN